MLKIGDVLENVERIGLDTSPFIYFIEESAGHKPVLDRVFNWISRGQIEAVTSVVTLTEVLVHPLLHGRVALCNQYRDLILASYHVRVVSIDAVVAERAAQLRATYNLRTPDALQLSAIIEEGCHVFLTNDAVFKRVSGIRTFALSDLCA